MVATGLSASKLAQFMSGKRLGAGLLIVLIGIATIATVLKKADHDVDLQVYSEESETVEQRGRKEAHARDRTRLSMYEHFRRPTRRGATVAMCQRARR